MVRYKNSIKLAAYPNYLFSIEVAEHITASHRPTPLPLEKYAWVAKKIGQLERPGIIPKKGGLSSLCKQFSIDRKRLIGPRVLVVH